jgi:hypothetical protein
MIDFFFRHRIYGTGTFHDFQVGKVAGDPRGGAMSVNFSTPTGHWLNSTSSVAKAPSAHAFLNAGSALSLPAHWTDRDQGLDNE